MRFLSISLVMVSLAAPPVCGQSTSEWAPTLQPGDLVRIQIWREPGLSGEFPVDPEGTVTLPLLGRFEVQKVPLDRLVQVLSDEYRVHLRNPAITIVPLRKVLVLGAVRTPGPYEVEPTETLIGVISRAGGADAQGNIRRIRIIRDGEVVHARAAIDATLSNLLVRSGDQIMVEQRSWLARNQSLVVSVLLALPSAIFAISRITE
jgi:protein involved in polysaccharide export with SLBB domain